MPVQLAIDPPADTIKIDNNLTKEKVKQQNPFYWSHFIIVCPALAGLAVACGILLAVFEIACLINEVAQDKIWRPNLEDLEKELLKNFKADFIDIVKKISCERIDSLRIIKRLANSNHEEVCILNYLHTHVEMTSEQLEQIFMGAHVHIKDNGNSYSTWITKIKKKKRRKSSHPSDTHQYAIRGCFIKELLFSQITKDRQVYTWFQLENHPLSVGYIIRHMFDYRKYRNTGHNQGPLGSSTFTDQKPLILNIKEEVDSKSTLSF